MENRRQVYDRGIRSRCSTANPKPGHLQSSMSVHTGKAPGEGENGPLFLEWGQATCDLTVACFSMTHMPQLCPTQRKWPHHVPRLFYPEPSLRTCDQHSHIGSHSIRVECPYAMFSVCFEVEFHKMASRTTSSYLSLPGAGITGVSTMAGSLMPP